jgi:hypothetical protein
MHTSKKNSPAAKPYISLHRTFAALSQESIRETAARLERELSIQAQIPSELN